MDKEEIEKLIHMNQRLSLVTGYAMSLIFSHMGEFDEKELIQYKWLCQAMDNLFYLDKPLPPMP